MDFDGYGEHLMNHTSYGHDWIEQTLQRSVLSRWSLVLRYVLGATNHLNV